MNDDTKVSVAEYADIKWLPAPQRKNFTLGGKRKTKRIAHRRRWRSNSQVGGSFTVAEYIPDTLGISQEEFIALWQKAPRGTTLGRGMYAEVSRVQLGPHIVAVKELYKPIPATNTPNAYTRSLAELVENEIAVLSELTRNPATRRHITPLIAVIKVPTLEGGGVGEKRKFSELEESVMNLSIPPTPSARPTLPRFALKIQERQPAHIVKIITSYIHGDTLANLYETRRDMFTPAFLATLLTDFTTAIKAVHAAGWMHRDIHPGNLYVELDDAGNYIRALLIDFGAAVRMGVSAPPIGPLKYQSMRLRNALITNYRPGDDLGSLELSLDALRIHEPRRNMNTPPVNAESSNNEVIDRSLNGRSAMPLAASVTAVAQPPARKKPRLNGGRSSRSKGNHNKNI